MPDFLAAARRHLDDGDLLYQQSRIPNAVQLWAYGAECTLKALALKQNHFKVGPKDMPTNGFGLHINQIKKGSDLLSLYNAAQTGTSALMGPATAFVGWDINARYEDGSQLQPGIAQYVKDAGEFRNMLNSTLFLEGL